MPYKTEDIRLFSGSFRVPPYFGVLNHWCSTEGENHIFYCSWVVEPKTHGQTYNLPTEYLPGELRELGYGIAAYIDLISAAEELYHVVYMCNNIVNSIRIRKLEKAFDYVLYQMSAIQYVE